MTPNSGDISHLVQKVLTRRKESNTTVTSPAPIAPVAGTVTSSNERGLLLAGETAWRNWSKFAPTPKYIPSVGERVALSLDKQGYIRMITNEAGTEKRPAPADIDIVPRSGFPTPGKPRSYEEVFDAPTPIRPGKPASNDYIRESNAENERIVKLSLIKTAASVWGEASDADPAVLSFKIAHVFRDLLALYGATRLAEVARPEHKMATDPEAVPNVALPGERDLPF